MYVAKTKSFPKSSFVPVVSAASTCGGINTYLTKSLAPLKNVIFASIPFCPTGRMQACFWHNLFPQPAGRSLLCCLCKSNAPPLYHAALTLSSGTQSKSACEAVLWLELRGTCACSLCSGMYAHPFAALCEMHNSSSAPFLHDRLPSLLERFVCNHGTRTIPCDVSAAAVAAPLDKQCTPPQLPAL